MSNKTKLERVPVEFSEMVDKLVNRLKDRGITKKIDVIRVLTKTINPYEIDVIVLKNEKKKRKKDLFR